MRKRLVTLVIIILAALGLGSQESVRDEVAVGFSNVRGFATTRIQDVQIVDITLSSASFENLATTSFELIPDPGDNKVVHLLSIVGYRNFSSESWDSNNGTDGAGIGVGYDDDVDIVASFSWGFVTGGAASSEASPSYEVKFPVDYVASPSEAIVLKRELATPAHSIDGDTSFMFRVLYKILNLP